MHKIFYKLFGRIKPLKPGTYETRLRSVKETEQGNFEVTLDNVKKRKSR